jgi:hypothetical protein
MRKVLSPSLRNWITVLALFFASCNQEGINTETKTSINSHHYPLKFRYSIEKALFKYPHLKKIQIEFILCKQYIPLTAQWNIFDTFKAPHKRRYRIYISESSCSAFQYALLQNLPLYAQIGIIGHELAHIDYYLHSNGWELISIALRYIFPSFVDKFEHSTDKKAIEFGFEKELLNYSFWLSKHKINTKKTNQVEYPDLFKRNRRYLKPSDISIYN